MLLLVAVAITSGPWDTLRPYNVASDDLVKLREMAEKAKAAKEAGGVVAEEERPAAAEPEVEQRRRGLPAALSILSPKRALPVCAAAGATAFVLQRRRTELQRLTDEIESAIEALRELTGSSRRIETPPPGNIRTQRASLTEFRARKSLLEEHILPQLNQLADADKQEQLHGGSKPLAARSSTELADLNATLSARVEASGTLLAEYESLGQPAPPHFRMWPIEELRTRLNDMRTKREELREIVRLLAQLGGQRMEWSMPERSLEELAKITKKLKKKVRERAERKEKAELLGKVEAELWRREEEVPIATSSLSIPELRALLAKLQGATEDDTARGK